MFGKVLEAMAEIQLRTFLETHNLLGQHQHGFRKSRSTNTALLSTYIKLREAKEEKLWQGILCFDLSAAYDVLDPNILLEKLKLCGLSSLAIAWMRSFLTNRRQAVQISQTLSPEVPLNHGIPQGSSISCLLFVFFVADYPLWISSNVQSFADDTIIYTSGSSPENVLKTLENEANKTFQYFASNGLVANPGKTVLMMIKPKGNSFNAKQKIILDGKEIMESKCERMLGVSVSNDLKWNSHISKVKQKVNHGLYTLKRLKKCLDQKNLRIIAEGLVSAHFRYCNATFLSEKVRMHKEDTLNKDMNDLQMLQNRMMRTVLGIKLTDKVSIEKMLCDMKMLSVNQQTCLSILMETWKSLNLGIESISQNFQRRSSLRYSNNLQGDRDPNSFISRAAKLYNMTSEKFKTTNLTKVAQQEAKKLVKSLPI